MNISAAFDKRQFFRYILPALVVMIAIFWLSHQDREETMLRSGLLSQLCGWLGLDCAWIMKGGKAIYIRKAAHMTEYAVLAFLLLRWLRLSQSLPKAMIGAFLIALFYACTDEYHQTFIAGRGGSYIDVMIDAIGMALGVGFGWFLFRQKEKDT